MLVLLACPAFVAPYRHTMLANRLTYSLPTGRCRPPLLQADDLAGIDMQRLLGELTFSELTAATLPDAEATLRGGAAPA